MCAGTAEPDAIELNSACSDSRVRAGRCEPGPRIDRLAGPADLKVKLGTRLTAAVPRRGNRPPGGHTVAGSLEEPIVVPIQAQVAAAVVDDCEQSQAREPIRIDH